MKRLFAQPDTRVVTRALAVGFLLLGGCQQQMAVQPSFRPLEPSTFFDDGRSSRPRIEGTVARGHLRTDTALFTGRRGKDDQAGEASKDKDPENQQFVDAFPFPITAEIVEHGYHRYMIFCVSCHDPLGQRQGKIVERGYTAPPSFHIPRLREGPPGRFFAVISEGYGSMPSYRAQIPPRDRWAIVAYLRALQLSRHFPADRLSATMRQEWAQQRGTVPAGGQSP